MGCLYTPATNKITITGYTEAVPCTFTELHTQDKAGTLDLMPATLPALNMVLTTQIKPSDELALKIDFILASSGAGAGDTIDITGTDKDGSVQSETLTTEADGTFTTTKWFKTITDIDCNGFNAGTLTVRQNQWGVIWKLIHLQTTELAFSIDAFIYIGAAGVHGYFGDSKKVIMVERHKLQATYVDFMEALDDYGHITFGVADLTNKRGYHGVHFIANYYHTSKRGKKPFIKGKDVNVYGCMFQGTMARSSYQRTNILDGCNGKVYDCSFFGWYAGIMSGGDNLDVNGLKTADCLTPFMTCSALMTLKDSKVYNQDYGLYTGNLTARDLVISEVVTAVYVRYLDTVYMIDCILENWSMEFYTAGYKAYRQYTFNLKVIDKDGNDIDNVTVILKDKDGNTADQKGFSTTTNASGVIAEQIVSYGYYDWANGNTLKSYSPHTLEIKKAGYKTYKMKFTLDEKFNEKIMLAKVLDMATSKRIQFFNQ